MDVPAYYVANFFENYETSRTATRANSKYMADYVRAMNIDGLGGIKNWTVCLINVSGNGESFSVAGLNVGAGIFRKEGSGVSSFETTCSIHTMTSAGHEYFDYSQAQLDKEKALRAMYTADPSINWVNEKIRKETRPFDQGLLILYPIADAGKLTAQKGDHNTPFGFAAVFPDRKGKGNLKSYRMNDIALEKDNDEFYG